MEKDVFNTLFNLVKPVQDWNELYSLVNKVELEGVNRILEIGVEGGGTGKFWLTVIKNKTNRLYIGVDTNISKVGDKFDEFIDFGFVHMVEGESQSTTSINSVKKILGSSLFDFIYIDGSHKMEDVYKDVINYYPLLKNGGIMAFHDYGDINGGPYNAIKKLKIENKLNIQTEGTFPGEMTTYWFMKGA